MFGFGNSISWHDIKYPPILTSTQHIVYLGMERVENCHIEPGQVEPNLLIPIAWSISLRRFRSFIFFFKKSIGTL